MATSTLADITVTSSWQDIVATHASVASADVFIQTVSADNVQVVFGGASAPTGKTGVLLGTREGVQGNAANVWVKCSDEQATVSVSLV